MIDIDNDTPKAEEKAKPEPEPKHIPDISHDGQTEAVCVQRKEIKPSLKDIQKVQVLACLFILAIANNLRISFFDSTRSCNFTKQNNHRHDTGKSLSLLDISLSLQTVSSICLSYSLSTM